MIMDALDYDFPEAPLSIAGMLLSVESQPSIAQEVFEHGVAHEGAESLAGKTICRQWLRMLAQRPGWLRQRLDVAASSAAPIDDGQQPPTTVDF